MSQIYKREKRTINTRIRDIPFAFGHMYYCESQSLIATLIPKNASSFVKTLFAWYDADEPEFDAAAKKAFSDIHNRFNGLLLVKNFQEIERAKQSFIILRCPYRRAVSGFIDKFVIAPEEAIFQGIIRTARKEIDSITFSDFVNAIKNSPDSWLDPHFRSQYSYVIFEKYDHFFCVEDSESLKGFLETKAPDALKVINELAPKGINKKQYTTTDVENAYSFTVDKLRNLYINENKIPSEKCFFNRIIIRNLSQRYSDDISYYKNNVSEKLMFNN